MLEINGYYDGKEIVLLDKTAVKPNQKVIVTVLDEFIDIKEKNPKPFRKYVGKLDFTSFNEINEALKDTEKVDFNEW